jgi:hypothetical protein
VLHVSDCLFDDNWAYNLGQQVIAGGGGVANLAPGAHIERSVFLRNEASLGGGLYATAPTAVVNCLFSGNLASDPPDNVPFVDTGLGGGVYGDPGVALALKSCTIAANWSRHTAAGASMDGTFENCILWHNVAQVEPGDNPEDLVDQQFEGEVEVSFSSVAGLFDGNGPSFRFPGSIESDPQFVVAPTMTNNGVFTPGDLHLQGGSPCIDSGSNFVVPEGATTDLDGLPRFVDDLDMPDTGLGAPPLVDMGAFERQTQGLFGDLTGDGAVGGADLGMLLGAWGSRDATADLNGDSIVDGIDLGLLLSAWTSRT